MTARSDQDLTPESIVQKVADASGSKYSGGAAIPSMTGPPTPIPSKPVFTPTRSSGGGVGFNPLSKPGLRAYSSVPRSTDVDDDGWGQDAPPVTRTQLEKVQPSYQPTKVNMRELSSQRPEISPSNSNRSENNVSQSNDVVKGGYQPVGKVDIAALRRQAPEKTDDRPTPVRGSYEPVGKVDIAAIRARARQPPDVGMLSPSDKSPVTQGTSSGNYEQSQDQRSLPDRSTPLSNSERLTSLPKPKVTSRFGSSTGSFAGTKASMPSGFGLESKPTPTAPSIGVGRTFADQGGKTPAQLWAEKKVRERGLSRASDDPASGTSGPPTQMINQTSGQGKSEYDGRSWASVQSARKGQSGSSLGQQGAMQVGENQAEPSSSPVEEVGATRDRSKGGPLVDGANVRSGAHPLSPPPLETSSKPNAGRSMPIPDLPGKLSQSRKDNSETPRMPTPPAQPRSPTALSTPITDSGSPIRIAMPVARDHNDEDIVKEAQAEQLSPPPSMPTQSLAQVVPHEDELTEEPTSHDPARGAGEAAAASVAFGERTTTSAHPGVPEGGKRALVQYDYEKAEDNEIELKEGEYVINIEMVDDDWWMGENPRGESGLFPSNYVELTEDGVGEAGYEASSQVTAQPHNEPEQLHTGSNGAEQGATATALYDYEAAEGNELSFPENATITDIVSSWVLIATDAF